MISKETQVFYLQIRYLSHFNNVKDMKDVYTLLKWISKCSLASSGTLDPKYSIILIRNKLQHH